MRANIARILFLASDVVTYQTNKWTLEKQLILDLQKKKKPHKVNLKVIWVESGFFLSRN